VDKASLLKKIQEGVIEGESSEVTQWVEEGLKAGIDPLEIIDGGLTPGVEAVGAKFEKGEYFLPDMILGAEAMEAGIQILEPLLMERKQKREPLGTIILGTVAGDIHEIGKNIVRMMLKAAGFDVIDLGVDVKTDKFIEAIRESGASIVGMSALLTTTVGRQKEVIDTLEEEGLRKDIKVMVGGAPITQGWADKIGADSYAPDATAAVREAKRLVGKA